MQMPVNPEATSPYEDAARRHTGRRCRACRGPIEQNDRVAIAGKSLKHARC